MKHTEINLGFTQYPGLYTQVWQPEKSVKAVTILIHGLGEHCSRYGTDFAQFYTQIGMAIIAPDLPGHGKSDGIRGHIKDPILFLDLIDQLIVKAKELFPRLPIFLYGHSMGGEIMLWYTLARNPKVNGVVITSPVIGPKDPVPPMKLFLAKTMNTLLPSFRMDNGLALDQLSRDHKIVEAYRTDPLVHRQISASLGMMIINRGNWILEHASENKNPMLVMVGSKEGIVNKEAVDQFGQSAPNVDYKIWPGLFHELHNEPEKREVFEYTSKWMKKHL